MVAQLAQRVARALAPGLLLELGRIDAIEAHLHFDGAVRMGVAEHGDGVAVVDVLYLTVAQCRLCLAHVMRARMGQPRRSAADDGRQPEQDQPMVLQICSDGGKGAHSNSYIYKFRYYANYLLYTQTRIQHKLPIQVAAPPPCERIPAAKT